MVLNPELKKKLDAFIRKYYKNELLKGLLWFSGLTLLYFLGVSLIEALGRFSGEVRMILFILLIGGILAISIYYLLRPMLGLLRLGKHLSYKQAALIIGKHFPELSDKVVNTLEMSALSDSDNRLIQASIAQRMDQIKPVPFVRAVNYRESLRFWPVVAIPVAVFLLLIIFGQWENIREGSKRIAQYEKEFAVPAPFRFVLLNDSLSVERGGDLMLQLRFEGDKIPAAAEMVWSGGKGRFIRKKLGEFSYPLENIRENFSFHIEANGFSSAQYEVAVVEFPELKYSLLQVVPPPYTGLRPFQSENSSVSVPVGSRLRWTVSAITTEAVRLQQADTAYSFQKENAGAFSLERRVLNSFEYHLTTHNRELSREGGPRHRVEVTPDEYPLIAADLRADSSRANHFYYQARMSDDYGLRRFEVVISRRTGDELLYRRELAGVPLRDLAGILNLDSLKGEQDIENIYFRVWDNDGVQGSKSSKSQLFKLNLLSLEEQRKQLQEQKQEMAGERQEWQKVSETLSAEMQRLREKLMNSPKGDWKDKNRLQEILKMQEELLKRQAELRKQEEKVKEQEDKLENKEEQIADKEEQIEDLKKQSQAEKKLEELMKELEELMKDMDIEQIREKLKQMEQENRDMQRSEKRIDELMKDLEFQKDVLREVDELRKLAEKMEDLSKESNEKSDEENRQQAVEEDLKESLERLDELKEENELFREEAGEKQTEETEQEISEEMQKSQDNLQKNQQQKANQSQQKAGQKMQEMSDKMLNSLMEMNSDQHQENMQTLRQILENLEILSVDIEELSELSKSSGKSDPLYRRLLVEQKRLQQGSQVIKDSLLALGERVPVIQETVYRELALIEDHLLRGMESLQEQQSAKSASHQQFVMTSANNLALLLDEALRNMQQQMAQMSKGEQSCQKPGGGKPSLSNMQKMQSELAKQMGQMPQGNKPNGQQGQPKGEGRNGQEIVEMLSRQEMIRSQLESFMKENEGQGGNGELHKALQEMKEVEKDLLDGQLSERSLIRMKTIETRLLQSEKAQREREMDEQREGRTAEEVPDLYDRSLEEYLRQRESEKELIFRDPLRMQPYYKDKTRKYLQLQQP